MARQIRGVARGYADRAKFRSAKDVGTVRLRSWQRRAKLRLDAPARCASSRRSARRRTGSAARWRERYPARPAGPVIQCRAGVPSHNTRRDAELTIDVRLLREAPPTTRRARSRARGATFGVSRYGFNELCGPPGLRRMLARARVAPASPPEPRGRARGARLAFDHVPTTCATSSRLRGCRASRSRASHARSASSRLRGVEAGRLSPPWRLRRRPGGPRARSCVPRPNGLAWWVAPIYPRAASARCRDEQPSLRQAGPSFCSTSRSTGHWKRRSSVRCSRARSALVHRRGRRSRDDCDALKTLDLTGRRRARWRRCRRRRSDGWARTSVLDRGAARRKRKTSRCSCSPPLARAASASRSSAESCSVPRTASASTDGRPRPVALQHRLSNTLRARAGVPAWFDRGTRRPDPAGRALLALLACANEDSPRGGSPSTLVCSGRCRSSGETEAGSAIWGGDRSARGRGG